MVQITKSIKVFKQIALWSILSVLSLLVFESGWALDAKLSEFIRFLSSAFIIVHFIALMVLYFGRDRTEFTGRKLTIQGVLCAVIIVIIYKGDPNMPVAYVQRLDVWRLLFTGVLVCLSLFSSISAVLKWLTRGSRNVLLPPAFLFLVTLICLATVGGLLLLMPNCTTDAGISPMNAFFISVSAVCVTGLTPVNVSEIFTPMGHFIIIILIQVGGFGVMTFAYFVAMIMGQGFSLRDKVLMKDLFNEETVDSTSNFLKTIILMTFLFEGIGALGLWISWQGISLPEGSMPLAWHAIFHSVSAFNNAGFSTFNDGLCNPTIVNNRLGQGFIMMMIVAGGLGFMVYKESYERFKEYAFKRKERRRRRWSTHIKLTLFMTVILIFGGALLLWAIEMTSHPRVVHESWTTILWQSLFNSISGRTAGFNINYLSDYSAPAVLVLSALMMIGGSPGGTAGGLRTTTFAVVLREVYRMIKGRKDVEFWGRAISRDVVDRCVSTVVVCGIWVGSFTAIICYLQPEIQPLRLFFESVSAFGTVGLSLDVTSQLTDSSKFFIMVNMIAGRVGLFSFLVAIAGQPTPRYYRYPETKLPLN